MDIILVKVVLFSEVEQDTRDVQECSLHESEGATEEVSKIVFRAKVYPGVFVLSVLPTYHQFTILN